MNFSELPSDWAQRPITDVDLFEGVVDLVVTDQSRADGAVHLLLCHTNGRLLQPVVVRDPDWTEPRDQVVAAFTGLFAGLVEQGVPGAVMALARPGGLALTSPDETYFSAFRTAARDTGFGLLGLALATEWGVRSVPHELIDLADGLPAAGDREDPLSA